MAITYRGSTYIVKSEHAIFVLLAWLQIQELDEAA